MHPRDVKPENVILEGGGTGGRLFLVDFGGVQVRPPHSDMGFSVEGWLAVAQGLEPGPRSNSSHPNYP